MRTPSLMIPALALICVTGHAEKPSRGKQLRLHHQVTTVKVQPPHPKPPAKPKISKRSQMPGPIRRVEPTLMAAQHGNLNPAIISGTRGNIGVIDGKQVHRRP